MTVKQLPSQLQPGQLYRSAKKIREWLQQISGTFARLNESPNPYYGHTMDGLTLICSYGHPQAVGTPVGQWGLSGGGCAKNGWLEEATERLGLVEISPMINNRMGSYGPIYAITKDVDGNELPKTEFVPTQVAGFICSYNQLTPWTDEDLRDTLAFHGAKTVEDSDPHRSSLEYEVLHSLAWPPIKADVGHLDWDDRMDPVYKIKSFHQFDFEEVERVFKGMKYSLRHAYYGAVNTTEEDRLVGLFVHEHHPVECIQAYSVEGVDFSGESIRLLLSPRIHKVEQLGIVIRFHNGRMTLIAPKVDPNAPSLPDGVYEAAPLVNDDPEDWESDQTTFAADWFKKAPKDLYAINNHDFCDDRFYSEAKIQFADPSTDLNRMVLKGDIEILVTDDGNGAFIRKEDFPTLLAHKKESV